MARTILLHPILKENAMDFFDGRQVTAARALAGLTVVELAQDAGVASRTIHRLEVGGVNQVAEKMRHGHVSRDVIGKIVDALARRGVELLPEGNGYGSGARWKLPRAVRRALGPNEGAGFTRGEPNV
jgi:DNA-binding XRE family transcriptional regulator